MRTLRIGFADTFFGLADKFFEAVLSQRYNVIRDDENPQILIFGDENFGTKNLSYDEKKVIKVFFTGENRRFWNYKCHYGLTFDHIDDDRHFRMPLYVPEIWGLINQHGYAEVDPPVEKTSFCSFMNSNAGCHKRNNFFNLLNSYKQVDSGGPLFNNIGHVIPRGTKEKIDFLKPRKFNLCFENGSHPGYVTEKIVHAFYARTVPIYWGSSTVEIDFNPDAFLNWHDYCDDRKFLERIKEVDNDDDLYYSYLNASPTRNDLPNKFMDMNRFLDWFDSRIVRDINE